MRRVFVALFFFILALPQDAAAQLISDFPIGGTLEGAPAAMATLGEPRSIAVDAAGNLYVADIAAHRVLRVNAAGGALHVVAGTGVTGEPVDGVPGPQSPFYGPDSVSVGASGSILIADGAYNRIRQVDAATGVITTRNLMMDACPRMAVGDSAGNVYFYNPCGAEVRRIDSSGAGSTVNLGVPANIGGLALDSAGSLYVSNVSSNTVIKYSPSSGATTTIAGTGGRGFSGDGGAATAAQLSTPAALSIDAAGNVYFVDFENRRVRRIDVATGNISTVAGGGTGGDGGAATDARLSLPAGLAMHGSRIYVSELGGRVRMIEGGIISTYAGGGGGPGVAMPLGEGALAFDTAGNLFIANPFLRRVYRVDALTGAVVTVAGNGADGPAPPPFGSETGRGDGRPAREAFLSPSGIAVDASGNVFVSESSYGHIRRIDAATGTITTFAGTGGCCEGGDGGPAISVAIGTPGPLAFDPAGNLHFATAQRIRRIDKASGILTTVAGGGSQIAPPDGTPATSAWLSYPAPLAFDSAGNLYIADSFTYRIDTATGLMRRLGSGGSHAGIAVDGGGNVYVSNGLQVQRFAASDGRSTTVAGTNRNASVHGDGGGFATTANMFGPRALAIGPAGHLHVSDGTRVRKVTLEGISASPPSLDFPGRLPQRTSPPQSFVLTQLGPSAVTINSIAAPAGFAVTHDCGAALAARASCVVNVTFTPGAVGNFNGILDVDATLVAQDVALTGSAELSLVTHYYESILRRPPDSIGKPFWDSERTRMQGLGASINETWFAMSSYFLASAEYASLNRSATDFTTDLYRTFFDRAPDAPGQQFWIDQMANGMPREVVLASFQHSPEFAAFTQGLFGNTAARAEVDMVMDFYRGLLGRLPDNNGFNAWMAQMRQAQCQGASHVAARAETISEFFATSSEYEAKNRTNAQYVGDLYNAFLRRGGDLAGVNAWIASLDQGTYTRRQLRDFFRSSTEFQGRVNAVVAEGCMTP